MVPVVSVNKTMGRDLVLFIAHTEQKRDDEVSKGQDVRFV
jgi:hypothetical protein